MINSFLGLLAKINMMGAEVPEGIPPEWAFVWKVLLPYVQPVLIALLTLCAAAGAIYAIVLGVKMARADSTEKREEAKKSLVNLIVALAITIGLIALMIITINTILPAVATSWTV